MKTAKWIHLVLSWSNWFITGLSLSSLYRSISFNAGNFFHLFCYQLHHILSHSHILCACTSHLAIIPALSFYLSDVRFTCSAFFSSSARVSCSLLCFASNWDTWIEGWILSKKLNKKPSKIYHTNKLSEAINFLLVNLGFQLFILFLKSGNQLLVSWASTHLANCADVQQYKDSGCLIYIITAFFI